LPVAGKCPDCGAVVPIPEVEPELSSSAEVRASYVPPDHETPTEELSTADMAALEAWAQSHAASPSNGSSSHRMKAHVPTVEEDDNLPKTLPLHPSQPMPKPAKKPTKIEAGLRVCPRCGKPVHLSAETCRDCGAHVPKR
jgi:RNA polymerase-binding transcription factor DksA